MQTSKIYYLFLCLKVPSAPPQSPSGSALSTTVITLTWDLPPAFDINGIIEFHLVEVTEIYTGISWMFHAVDTHINVGPVHPYFVYECRVATFTVGLGPFTAVFYVTSGEASKCCSNCIYRPTCVSET